MPDGKTRAARAASFARETAFAVATGLGVLLVAALILFTVSQVIAEIPFGDDFLWANVGLLAALVIAVVALATAIEAGARRWGKALTRSVLVAPVGAVVVIAVLLSLPPAPTPVEFTEPYLPGRPHDVIVLVDPNDPYVSSLARQARLTPGAAIAPTQTSQWGTDVAFGLAVLQPPGADAPWTLAVAPTPDHERVVQALAGLERNAADAASDALPFALRDLGGLGPNRGEWRDGATRTVALVTDRLPPPVGADWNAARAALAGSTVLRLEHPRRSSVSVLYRNAAAPEKALWTAWANRAAGNISTPNEGFALFDHLAFLSLNRFSGEDFLLALQYRPHLKLHSEERFLPLEVETFVARTKPKLCQPRQVLPDSCTTYDKASLLYGAEGYLRLGGERRGGEDLPADDRKANQAIYYNILRKPGYVSIEYWWFFRFNASPVWDGVMCLAGLSVLERSCFDHQGDWEGVTVTLKDDGALRPVYVSFYGHNWPGYRYQWSTLQEYGSIAKWEALRRFPQFAGPTHPVVYVAKGSHASYPRECLANCTQLDFRFHVVGIDVPVPDGEHDGFRDAPTQGCLCLLPLPVDFDGRPATWNAFRGNWGAPLCTFVLKACTRSNGPPSPAFQKRYSKPRSSVWASVEAPALTGSEPPS